jgi:hypothetical protein
MAGIINTGTHPKLLWPGVRAILGQIYAEHMKEYPELYEILDSDQAYEEDVQVTGFQLPVVKAEGTSGTYDAEVQGIITRYTHIAYSLGFIVTEEEQDDNLYEKVATDRAKANAFSIQQGIENVAAFLYNNAFSSTYFTTGDGVALCSNAHINATGGTYSNVLSPGADLSEASLEDLTIQIMGAQNDRGLLINIMPRSLHIARQEWYNAERILKSVLQSDTSSNNINVLKATNAFPAGIKMNHYFTTPHAWFIRTNCQKGMTMFWRKQPDLKYDNDFSTRNILALAVLRYSLGCTDPRGVYGSNGP